MQPGIDHIGAAVAFFCHDGQGNFVLHKRGENARDQHGTWDFGGGGIKFGETIEQALWRELHEEYGCTGEIEQILKPGSFIINDDGVHKHWLVILYIIQVRRDDVIIGEPDTMAEIDWFTLDKLPDPLHPGAKVDVKRNWDLLKQYIPTHATHP